MLESRAERSAVGAAPDIAVVGVGLSFLCPKTQLNLNELLKNHTSKQTNGPRTISDSASDFAQHEACFDLNQNKRDDLTKI